MKPTPEDLAILRALVVSGAVTKTELRKPFPDLLVDRIDVLYSHGLVHQDRIPNKPSIWQINFKGRRALEKAERPQWEGEIPTPKYRPPHQDYKPAAVVVTRPGAMDAYALPSLVGGEVVERRAPIINGGSKERG